MSDSVPPTDPRIAIAGGSGFVGSHLIDHLCTEFRFRALSRSRNVVASQRQQDRVEWHQCDLYSLPKVTAALKGCDIGIYLVHSMEPSSRLVQGSFEDTDLLLADNFIRAAEAAGIRHVIYLSGLMPEDPAEELSPHLRSRLEVESVLGSRKVKLTVLRAGLIFGPGGSSFSMLVNLVRRLPWMILPAWVHSRTHSIDIEDVCRAFRLCLVDEELAGVTHDLGGHEPMTYRQMIEKTAGLLGKRRGFVNFPYNCFHLSKHWVSLFAGVPPALVGPLQESLRHDLSAAPNPLLQRLEDEFVPFTQSLQRGIDGDGRPKPNPRSHTRVADRREIRQQRRVRSIQRMPLPAYWSAKDLADEYAVWLSRRFRGLIQATTHDDGVIRFRVLRTSLTLLELSPSSHSRGNPRRIAFHITGGMLSRRVEPLGRLEFRTFPELGSMIASIHDFAPTLPWWIYVFSQARIHLQVMRSFARHLAKLPPKTTPESKDRSLETS